MSFFISAAVAATQPSIVAQPDGMFSMMMIVAIFVLFYLMLIRPQNKRAKEQREMINQLKKGDEIVTTGGLAGKIINLEDQYVSVKIAEGVEVKMQRSAINTILPKGTLKSLLS